MTVEKSTASLPFHDERVIEHTLEDDLTLRVIFVRSLAFLLLRLRTIRGLGVDSRAHHSERDNTVGICLFASLFATSTSPNFRASEPLRPNTP